MPTSWARTAAAIGTALASWSTSLQAQPARPAIAGILWPSRPALRADRYPDCVDDYRQGSDDYDKLMLARRCTQRLEYFNGFILNDFAQTTSNYLQALLDIDARIRRMRPLPPNITQARDYIIFEQNAFRRDSGNHTVGREMRQYYEYYARYLNDSADLCDIRNHLSMRQELCTR